MLANLGATVRSIIVAFVKRAQSHTPQLVHRRATPRRPAFDRYEAVSFGPKTAGKIVRGAVLELTYTARDMAPFARDMGYVDKAGKVKPPFAWDEAPAPASCAAKLDAVFFHLYGVTDRDDIRYIYSTFPIVERKEKAILWGRVPFLRALPRLDERSCCGKSRRGGQALRGHHTKREKSYAKENLRLWRCRVEVNPSLSSGKAAQWRQNRVLLGID